MFGARVLLLGVAVVICDSKALRSRQLQWTGDSNEKVVPQCKAGYNDVSGGSAFYWSCAFHCDGGPYFATEGCICACLTPEQERAWRGMITTLPPQPFSPIEEPARDPQDIVLTPPPATTRPFVPVQEIHVGELHSEYPSPTAAPAVPFPSSGAPALPPGFTLETPTVPPPAEVKHNEALDLNVVMIALVSAGVIAALTFVLIFCFNCRSVLSICRKSPEQPKVAAAPVLRLYADEKSNAPNCNVQAPSSRASSKMSTASGASNSQLLSNSRRSSKASTNSQPQKDTSSLLKLPRNDGDVASGTNSVESLSSWAREVRPSLQPPGGPFPGRGRSSSRGSAGSQETRSLPLPSASSSRRSSASQDGTQSISSTTVVLAGRKVSKVRPVVS